MSEYWVIEATLDACPYKCRSSEKRHVHTSDQQPRWIDMDLEDLDEEDLGFLGGLFGGAGRAYGMAQ